MVEKEHEIGIPYASEKGRKGQTNEVGKEWKKKQFNSVVINDETIR